MAKAPYLVKVLHVPCNTPYVRKLQALGSMEIANGVTLSGGITIPEDVTYRWVLEQRENALFWNSFDVCHLHYGFEFEAAETVRDALALLRERKPIVYTCHELCSMHGVPQERYDEHLSRIMKSAAAVITLTSQAKTALSVTHPELEKVTVIPHGYVVPPNSPLFGGKRSKSRLPEILFFGALRKNRDIATSLINTLADSSLACRIGWVTRPFTEEQLSTSPTLRTALCLAKNNERIRLELTLPLADDKMALRIGKADITVLPNLFAGHSGQLEAAFDCGLLPVITDVGFLNSQLQAWPKENPRMPYAVVANWSDGKTWLYQTRLHAAVREALSLLPSRASSIDVEARKRFRSREHKQVLEQHLAVYSAAIRGGR